MLNNTFIKTFSQLIGRVILNCNKADRSIRQKRRIGWDDFFQRRFNVGSTAVVGVIATAAIGVAVPPPYSACRRAILMNKVVWHKRGNDDTMKNRSWYQKQFVCIKLQNDVLMRPVGINVKSYMYKDSAL